eukprot:scaffold41516_cov53-Phaeocystis_antarctica.AAC.2
MAGGGWRASMGPAHLAWMWVGSRSTDEVTCLISARFRQRALCNRGSGRFAIEAAGALQSRQRALCNRGSGRFAITSNRNRQLKVFWDRLQCKTTPRAPTGGIVRTLRHVFRAQAPPEAANKLMAPAQERFASQRQLREVET